MSSGLKRTSTTGPLISTTVPTPSRRSSRPSSRPSRCASVWPLPTSPRCPPKVERWKDWPLSLSVIKTPPLACGQGLGARRDLADLPRYLGLTRLVHLERQVLGQLVGVVGGVLHRRHPRPVLPCRTLEECLPDHRLHVAGDELPKDGVRVG